METKLNKEQSLKFVKDLKDIERIKRKDKYLEECKEFVKNNVRKEDKCVYIKL
jgi:hypothetical protein